MMMKILPINSLDCDRELFSKDRPTSVFVKDIGGQFRINKGAMVASDRDPAHQIWGPVASGKEDHLACANEKGDHLLSNQTDPGSHGSNGVAQTVPEAFLSSTVHRLSQGPAAC